MKIAEIVSALHEWAHPALQEDYDNSGLLVGESQAEVKSALVSLDVTDDVLEEAREKGANLLITHHPLIFGGLKRLTSRNYVERLVMKALRYDIALMAIHTNLDNITGGVNSRIAEKLSLKNCRILQPKKGLLRKLVVYVPQVETDSGEAAPDAVRKALWRAGAGKLGDYSEASINLPARSSFRPNEDAEPFIGEKSRLNWQEETRIEFIFPQYLEGQVMVALHESHPYEEPVYDMIALQNPWLETGAGLVGELEIPMPEYDFLLHVKNSMHAGCIRHTQLLKREVKKVAVCGGAGSFLLETAVREKADFFITGDFKYHQFFDADGRIVIADIGHYESEQFTIELILDKLREKFPTFAASKSVVSTNPIHYF